MGMHPVEINDYDEHKRVSEIIDEASWVGPKGIKVFMDLDAIGVPKSDNHYTW